MLTVKEIVGMMNNQVEQIAKHLLPNGRTEGREWVVGSINGEEGRSLKVCLSGTKVGVWGDFAAGQSGDLLDLWREIKGVSLKDALVEVKAYLGIQDPKFERPERQRKYRKPSVSKEAKKVEAGSKVMDYLTKERKLTPEALAAYRIAEVPSVGPWENWKNQKPWTGPWIVLPSFRDDSLMSVKYLHTERPNGKKQTLVEANCEPVLFGWQAIPPGTREITICEGEIDAPSLFMYGYPALSVPFGGGKGDKQQWVDHEWEYLEPMEIINLCLDDDEEGKIATEELVKRLGVHRCRIVTLPRKDANQCLKDGVPKEEIDKAFANAVMIEPDELKRANHFTGDVIAEFFPVGGKLPGLDSPWRKVPFRWLRGEVSTYTGINGHGKSVLLGQVILSGGDQGEKACIASMEMAPKKTLYRQVRQAMGKNNPDRDEITACLDWMSDFLWLFDLVGTGKVDRLMEVFEFAYRRHGIRHFVIDSLMKCGIAEDDYKGQKDFMERLCDFVQRTGCHVHLVAHSRKGEGEASPPGKLDIKGTGAISDLSFNCFTIWRNKRKEMILKAHKNGDSYKLDKGETIEDIRSQPDAVLICDKSRNVEGAEGKYPLWFDGPSMQYLEHQGDRVTRYFQTKTSKYTDDLPDCF